MLGQCLTWCRCLLSSAQVLDPPCEKILQSGSESVLKMGHLILFGFHSFDTACLNSAPLKVVQKLKRFLYHIAKVKMCGFFFFFKMGDCLEINFN